MITRSTRASASVLRWFGGAGADLREVVGDLVEQRRSGAVGSSSSAAVSSSRRALSCWAELGYHPDTAAQMLRRARSRQLGALFTMRHPCDVALVEGIHPAAEHWGYSIALGATGPSRDERKAVEDLLGYRVELAA